MSCCKNNEPSEQKIREAVRAHYAAIVSDDKPKSDGCCGTSGGSCFAPSSDLNYANQLGYSKEDLEAVPKGANIGQGCGNPTMFAQLKKGETVLDLGSGAGFDGFLAARAVGDTGHVIGVDMTPEMISKSREKAKTGGYGWVEFRLGEIEHLPVADESVDVVISNCVINLVPDKKQAFREVYRVLKKGGRVCISDVVSTLPLSAEVRNDLVAIAGCLGGATLLSDMEAMLKEAGLKEVKITPKDESKSFIKTWAPQLQLDDLVVSALIQAVKP